MSRDFRNEKLTILASLIITVISFIAVMFFVSQFILSHQFESIMRALCFLLFGLIFLLISGFNYVYICKMRDDSV